MPGEFLHLAGCVVSFRSTNVMGCALGNRVHCAVFSMPHRLTTKHCSCVELAGCHCVRWLVLGVNRGAHAGLYGSGNRSDKSVFVPGQP